MHLYIIDIFLNLYWDIIVVSAPLQVDRSHVQVHMKVSYTLFNVMNENYFYQKD